jgi:hypothetical protein
MNGLLLDPNATGRKVSECRDAPVVAAQSLPAFLRRGPGLP